MKKTHIWLLAIAAVCAGLHFAQAKSSNKTQVLQNLNIFNSIYKELHTSYVDSIDSDKAIRNAIDYMLSQIDPYTEYYPQSEQEDLLSISTGEFGGIGSIIWQRDGKIILADPKWDSPSRRAGVRHGDILIAIDGDTLPHGYTSTQATKRLRGQAGTKLRITVKRPYAQDSILDFEITRGMIRTNPVPYYGMLNDSVGYISVTTFNEHTAHKVKEALLSLEKNPKMQALVLDLRDNGGGLLESAVQIVGYFVPKGTTVLSTRYRDEHDNKTYKTTQKPIDTKIPMAVLVNGNTASAAEILSGSLQDLDRAVIIGERSYGKGLVQTSRPVPYDGLLKLTVARYYIPSGRLIQAIDYSHRNPDGSVARIPDSLTNVFRTAVGREVRDGGGITPDIKVVRKDMSRYVYNMVYDNTIYDYATRFRARQGENMPANDDDFVVNDSIYNDFKEFLNPEKYKYDRQLDNAVKMLRDAVKTEGYFSDSVSAQFDVLEQMLKPDMNRDLEFNSEALRRLIDTEITNRYYDEGVQLKRGLTGDVDVEAALELFATPGKYDSLLSAPK